MVCALPAAARRTVTGKKRRPIDELSDAWKAITGVPFSVNPDDGMKTYEHALPLVGRAGVAKIVRELLAERRKKGRV